VFLQRRGDERIGISQAACEGCVEDSEKFVVELMLGYQLSDLLYDDVVAFAMDSAC